jgi:hypothetical protein
MVLVFAGAVNARLLGPLDQNAKKRIVVKPVGIQEW